MFEGVFALLERSLRIELRSFVPHLLRLGLVANIYLVLSFELASGLSVGAPGLNFLTGIALLDITFISLLGIGFFSTVITEEKEEDTLGLMLMAGISPLGILLGKSVGTLWQSLILVAIQYPFMLLAITMGGVSHLQIWALTVALLAYVIFLAGMGLFCSTIAPRNRTAATMMTIVLALYFGVPGISQILVWNHVRWLVAQGIPPKSSFLWILMEQIGSSCIFLEVWTILSTGFANSAFSLQVISNSVAGCVGLGMSWLLFRFVTRDPATEANSRGFVALKRRSFRFNAGRPGKNPFSWKDFHFVSGGVGAMAIRMLYYLSLALGVYGFEIFVNPGWSPGEWVHPCLMLMSASIAIDAGLILARSLQDEVRGQTLSILMMLPQSIGSVIYAKYVGAMLGWLPGPIIELGLALSTEKGQEDLRWLTKPQYLFDTMNIVSWFVMIPHLAAFFSLYVRWGAVPLAIGVSVCGTLFTVFTTEIFVPQLDGHLFELATATLMVVICIACHVGVLLRVQVLGKR